jgi:hypothetical protein
MTCRARLINCTGTECQHYFFFLNNINSNCFCLKFSYLTFLNKISKRPQCSDKVQNILSIDPTNDPLSNNNENNDEEGEINDGETTKRTFIPRIHCKYYQRGKCSWGKSCKFLHPGVNDTGNLCLNILLKRNNLSPFITLV